MNNSELLAKSAKQGWDAAFDLAKKYNDQSKKLLEAWERAEELATTNDDLRARLATQEREVAHRVAVECLTAYAGLRFKNDVPVTVLDVEMALKAIVAKYAAEPERKSVTVGSYSVTWVDGGPRIWRMGETWSFRDVAQLVLWLSRNPTPHTPTDAELRSLLALSATPEGQ
jgi:hypothetical protein